MRLDLDHPDPSQYLAVLNGMLAFHTAVVEFSRESVEQALGPNTALLSRGQALRADISLMSQRLGVTTDQDCAAAGRPGLPNQLRGGPEERIGAAYVAAGSVLGGRVIAANLSAAGCVDWPQSFLAADGLDLGRRWRDFKAALDRFGTSGADCARVIAGAEAAFTLIRDILSWPDTTSGAA